MERSVIIVAHGQPSDPDAPERMIAQLADQVAKFLPDWRVASATLAAPEALQRAMEGAGRPLVFPFFMADGWFIRTLLPRRLAAAGAAGLTILRPFGLLSATQRLAATMVQEAVKDAGWREADVTLVLAAHGSGQSRKPSAAAETTRAFIAARTALREIRQGFIEEPPFLADALAKSGKMSILLPLFAARWGHVEDDIPAAVAKSGYPGHILPPIGSRPEVPSLIADAVRAGLTLTPG